MLGCLGLDSLVCLYGDAMIDVHHYSNEYPPMVSWLIREAMVGETAEHMGLYWSGMLEPNYPLPANGIAVLHAKDYVLIATPDYWEGELMEFIVQAEFERET